MVMPSVTTLRAPLFVPANRPERFGKAAASGADAVILDLEDAVDPAHKADARQRLACDFTDLPVIVRINGAGTPWHDDDMDAVAALPVAAILVPKAEVATLALICDRLGNRPVIALVETARGLADARAIAVQPTVVRLAFGSIDFCADIGCTPDSGALLPARAELVVAARLGGLSGPIDGVTPSAANRSLVFRDTEQARDLGMTGKLCIHPAQIAEVLRGFRPSQGQIDWARRVAAAGTGAQAVDGEMVDEPVRRRAHAILAKTEGFKAD